jgi:fatty acid desaturase
MRATKTEAFSLAEARVIVRDLFDPDERTYWVDFLATIFVGHACFGLARVLFYSHVEPRWPALALAAVAFAAQCACYYRAVMFVHEIVHLPERKLVAFRVVWNVLCGIPFLVPSFTYYAHLDHHRRKLFGTEQDGEYLPLASMSPWWILVYLSQCLWVPPVAVIRSGLLTPLTWFFPALRRWIHQRASSLVMDPSYIRPLPTAAALRLIRLQELACFFCLVGYVVVPLTFFHRWPVPLVIQGYATGVILILMNCLRTLASHRWSSRGQEVTFVEQMLDSITLDNDSLPAIILNPVGLRYHATHHLFPSMPYHNMRAAHKRLMQRLPVNSTYRQTVAYSVWPVIAKLWRQAREHSRQAADPALAFDAVDQWQSGDRRAA